MAIKQNPPVQIANLNIPVTQENQVVARSALLPQANLAVSETVMRENLEAFPGRRVPGFSGCSGPFGLFEGGAGSSAAKSEADVAGSGIDWAREEVTQARGRFQAGVASNIEAITAQDELARADDNRIVALCRCNRARRFGPRHRTNGIFVMRPTSRDRKGVVLKLPSRNEPRAHPAATTPSRDREGAV